MTQLSLWNPYGTRLYSSSFRHWIFSHSFQCFVVEWSTLGRRASCSRVLKIQNMNGGVYYLFEQATESHPTLVKFIRSIDLFNLNPLKETDLFEYSIKSSQALESLLKRHRTSISFPSWMGPRPYDKFQYEYWNIVVESSGPSPYVARVSLPGLRVSRTASCSLQGLLWRFFQLQSKYC